MHRMQKHKITDRYIPQIKESLTSMSSIDILRSNISIFLYLDILLPFLCMTQCVILLIYLHHEKLITKFIYPFFFACFSSMPLLIIIKFEILFSLFHIFKSNIYSVQYNESHVLLPSDSMAICILKSKKNLDILYYYLSFKIQYTFLSAVQDFFKIRLI